MSTPTGRRAKPSARDSLGEQGGDVGGDEHLAAPVADDEGGAAAAEGDEGVRGGAGDTGDGEGAAEVAGGAEDGGGQAVGLVALDEMGDDLGVGLGAKAVALGGQGFAELPIILDDAVVDDGQLGLTVEVRMRVGI